jgi:hypothetical protein
VISSVVIITYDIKSVTDVIDNLVIKRTFVSGKAKEEKRQRRKYHHLCLDIVSNSKSVEQEIIKRGYTPRILYKRNRGQMKEKKTDPKQ